MIVTFQDGKSVEGVLLARTDRTLRVALSGNPDVTVFSEISGQWVSEDCEPVHIQFEWERQKPRREVTEADCVCSKELAAQLIQSLLTGADSGSPDPNPAVRFAENPTLALHRVV